MSDSESSLILCEIDYSVSQFGSTVRWLDRCLKAHSRDDDQSVFPIVQGGLDLELREKCAGELLKRNVRGYAVGGLSGGESKEEFCRTVNKCTDFLPKDKPRYLMVNATQRFPLPILSSLIFVSFVDRVLVSRLIWWCALRSASTCSIACFQHVRRYVCLSAIESANK